MNGLKLVEDFVEVHISSLSQDQPLENHPNEIEEEDMPHHPSLRWDWEIMTVLQREDELRRQTKAMD